MSELKKPLEVTIANNLDTRKTSFTITFDDSIPTQKSWNGKEVLEQIKFKITQVSGNKLRYLRVKEETGRKIKINNETKEDWVGLLEDNNEIKDYGFIEILRKSDEDCGEVKLEFEYEWNIAFAKTYNTEISIGAFSLLKKEEYFLTEEWVDDYGKEGNFCRYVYNSKTRPVIFFDKAIIIKHQLSLSKKQYEYSPKEEFEKIIQLTRVYDTSRNIQISYKLKEYEITSFLENYYLKYNTEIEMEKFIDIYNKLEDDNIEIIPVFTTIKNYECILLPFSKNPNIVWHPSSNYNQVYCNIYFSHPNNYKYNCQGQISFHSRNFNEEKEISLLEFFFKGIGFYYNFEKGITQNQFYSNKPYWFYLFESSTLSQEEKNELIASFLLRDKMSGEEEMENNTKEESFHGESKIHSVSLFNGINDYEYYITNPYLQIRIDGSMKKTGEIYENHFFEEYTKGEQGVEGEDGYEPGTISLYDSQTVLLWFKEEKTSTRKTKFNKRDQGFQWDILSPIFTSDISQIDNVAILRNPQRLDITSNNNMPSNWSWGLITSNRTTSFVEREVGTQRLLNKVLLKPEEEANIAEDIAYLQNGYVILSNFSPKKDRIYSLEFSITLENLKRKETRSVECCQWVPFYTSFSTSPVSFSYDAVWTQKKVTASTNFYEKGLYKVDGDKYIHKTLYNITSLKEGDIYYECVDHLGNKSPYYDPVDQKFYGNQVKIPIYCTSDLNLFFSLKGKDGTFNFNKLLKLIKNYRNTNLISFPWFAAEYIQYKQNSSNKEEDWETSKFVFSKGEAYGNIVHFEDLTYTFPEEITAEEEFDQKLIMYSFFESPLIELELSEISPYYPLQFRSEAGPFYISWSYPALGKIPTLAYRRNRVGINTVKIDSLLTDIIVLQQLENQKSRYVTFYNLNDEITFQIDLETGNFYTSGSQQNEPMRPDE